MNKSQSQSFLHSKRNTTEIGNSENINIYNRTMGGSNNQQLSYKGQNHNQNFMDYSQQNGMGNSNNVSKSYVGQEVDFKKAYHKLAKEFKKKFIQIYSLFKEMQHVNPNLVPQSARQTYLGISGGLKQEYSMRTFDRSSVSQSLALGQTFDKKFDLQEFTRKQHEFEEKKRQRLAQLQEQMETQDIEECTFKPNTHRSQSANRTNRRYQQRQRNTDQFIEDQAKREEERKIKLNLQSEMLQIKQGEELKGKPQINQKSKKLIEKKKSQQHDVQDVHNRLYELNNKQKHQIIGQGQHDTNTMSEQSKMMTVDVSKSLNTNMSFKPQIQKKSQQLKRDKPIDQHLYEDFKIRQQKKEQKKLDSNYQEQQNQLMMTSKQLSHNSEKYFIQRFTKEIIKQWQTLSLDEVSQQNETLNYLIYKEFMVRLGFLNEKFMGTQQMEQDSQDSEKNIIYDLWKHLGGETKSHITLNNLRIVLLAILGVFVEPGLNRQDQNLYKIEDQQQYGYFNDQGDLFLNQGEIPKIQKEFYQFYLNRTQFEFKQREQRKQNRMQQTDFDFKPQVNNVSRDIAQKYREKMESIVQTKLSTIDWLVQPAKNPKWQETAEEIVMAEQLKECTFQPEVSQRKSSTRGKSQELMSHFRNRKDSSQSASKIRSRELMPNTGNKFNDLYELSKKMQPLKESQDKSAQDYEFERMKDECVFKPQIFANKFIFHSYFIKRFQLMSNITKAIS